MTACDITAEFVNQFFQWLDASGKNIGFSNLLDVLTEFENEEINRAVAQQIKNLVVNSGVCIGAMHPFYFVSTYT